MKLIRRKLLKAPLLGLVSRSFVMSGVSAQEKNSPKDESGNTFDVIVLGCGIAGVVAAYQARIDGASVALFEKMDRPAGNAICALWGGSAHGVLAIRSPREQKTAPKNSTKP